MVTVEVVNVKASSDTHNSAIVSPLLGQYKDTQWTSRMRMQQLLQGVFRELTRHQCNTQKPPRKAYASPAPIATEVDTNKSFKLSKPSLQEKILSVNRVVVEEEVVVIAVIVLLM